MQSFVYRTKIIARWLEKIEEIILFSKFHSHGTHEKNLKDK